MLCLALQGLTGLKRYWCGQSLGSHGQIVFTDDPYVIQVIFYNALGFFFTKTLILTFEKIDLKNGLGKIIISLKIKQERHRILAMPLSDEARELKI